MLTWTKEAYSTITENEVSNFMVNNAIFYHIWLAEVELLKMADGIMNGTTISEVSVVQTTTAKTTLKVRLSNSLETLKYIQKEKSQDDSALNQMLMINFVLSANASKLDHKTYLTLFSQWKSGKLLGQSLMMTKENCLDECLLIIFNPKPKINLLVYNSADVSVVPN